MHFLGLNGMPRRIPDYADGYIGWNNLMSYGSILTALSVILFLYIVSNTLFINKRFYLTPVNYSKFNNFFIPRVLFRGSSLASPLARA
jgi:heme/copper-type cytochrome/quinol oxidase subunit 1